ncbi:DUF6443 domain-containing protein [Bacteroides sp. 519]|uniref:DUF6443 domain-containing protein n=1 Tax=Bacteroides sp. 519 TaxID=2302937 RepID=UPI0013D45DFC|nr:DUF6443 domain-containing protein [Bacteroides sp. 519]NDV58066.1 hypothetical protein [Bacteroides sp. 519]
MRTKIIKFSKYMLTISALLLMNIYYARGQTSGFETINQPFPDSPNAAALSKYIDFPVSNATGIIQMDIPIYEIKLKDFTLPISLNYHAKGIQVEESATNVGLGWSLQAGGCISRAVRGEPDDYNKAKTKEKHQKGTPYVGMFWTDKGQYINSFNENITEYDKIAEKIKHLVANDDIKYLEEGHNDTQPDLFYINQSFLSGQFVLEVINSVTSSPQHIRPQLIPYQDIKIQHAFDTEGRLTSFTVKDAQGNEYYFNDKEITIAHNSNFYVYFYNDPLTGNDVVNKSATGSSREYYSTWQLSKIKTVHNQIIRFHYQDETIKIENHVGSYEEPYILKYSGSSSSVLTTLTQKRLTKIETDNEEINFVVDQENITDQFLPIKGISVKSKHTNKTIKSFILKYGYFGNKIDCTRLKLNHIKEEGVGNYDFHYDERTPFPDRESYAQDVWGFYNGAISNENLLPTIHYYPNLRLSEQYTFLTLPNNYEKKSTIIRADRLPNPEAVTTGMLTKITYPTGGYTEYEYESNNFLYKDTVYKGGGVRIKSIKKYHDSSTLLMQKHYEYSNGKILNLPILSHNLYPFEKSLGIFHKSQSEVGKVNGGFVCYESVTIKDGNGSMINGKTEYSYSCPGTYGIEKDYSEGEMYEVSKSRYVPYKNFQDSINFYPYPPNINYDWARGLLLSEKYYDVENNPLKEISYKYKNYFPQGTSKPIVVYGLKLVYTQDVSVKFSKYKTLTNVAKVLSSKTETNYFTSNNSSVTSFTSYSYDNLRHKNVTTQKTTTSNGDTLLTKFKYMNDYYFGDKGEGDIASSVASTSEGISALYDKNVNKLVEESYFLKKKNTLYLLGSNLITYSEFGDYALPCKYYEMKLETPVEVSTSYVPSFVKTSFMSNPVFYRDSRYKEKQSFELYDPNGNLQQVSSSDGMMTTYIWSYNGQYPVAELKNCAYAGVSLKLGSSFVSNVQKTLSTANLTLLNNLRTLLPYAQITTAVYDPGIGVKHITDPSGKTTFYEYDSGRRLEQAYIKNGTTKEIIQAYEYDYANWKPLEEIPGMVYVTIPNAKRTITPTVASDQVTKSTKSAMLTIEYFDGIGRPTQTIQQGITPLKSDLVIIQQYDAYGRSDKTWLPFVKTDDGTVEDPDIDRLSADTYNGDTAAYTKPIYEASPLNRVTKQYGAGQQWRSSDKPVRTIYLSNVSALNCMYFNIADSSVDSVYTVTKSGNYATGQLYIIQIKDEDGNSTFEFKDKQGKVIMIRQCIWEETVQKELDTYYVYDDFGNLKLVLPPLASAQMGSGNSWTNSTSTFLDDYAYYYRYDEQNRCVLKKLPGALHINYVYDRGDRLILTQDGEARTKEQWYFTLPDALGRTVLTGICSNPSINIIKGSAVKATWAGESGTYKGYITPINCLGNSSYVLTANYYDNYNFLSLPGYSALGYQGESGYGTRHTSGINNGLLTGTYVKDANVDEGSIHLYSALYYDYRNRVIETQSTNHLGGKDSEYIAYTFTGQISKRKLVHTNSPSTPLVTTINGSKFKLITGGKVLVSGAANQLEEYYEYIYDHAGRLTRTDHQLGNNPKTTIAIKSYDELGRLKTHKKGNLPVTTYDYNVRSWIKSINNTLFTQTLYYNDSYADNDPCYNGNISAMSWKADSDVLRGYRFTYDALSRLTKADYLENGKSNPNYQVPSITYDHHGNITSLKRWGKTDSGYELVDNLTMNYNGNQLTTIEDAAIKLPTITSGLNDFRDIANTTDYVYNKNGAMTKDLNKSISNVTYNCLNLPSQLTINGNTNKYMYAADGRKLKVTHGLDYTDYVGNKIYENDSLKQILFDGGYIENGIYHFYLTDYLGNNRIVTTNTGIIVQKNHFYPFGMTFGETSNNEQDKQQFKYNGKELDRRNGLNLYDYSARYMEPAIGRFTTMDPLAEKYYNISPYAYCANNPIKFIDPTGMFYGDYYSGYSGKLLFSDGINDNRVYVRNLLVEQNDLIVRDTYIGQRGKIPDKTKAFNEFMKGTNEHFSKLNKQFTNNEALILFGWAGKINRRLKAFADLVTDNAEYDIKAAKNGEFAIGTDGAFMEGYAFYDGDLFRYDDFGNFNYAIAGKAFGLSEFILELGAGINQLTKPNVPHNIFTYGDEDKDNYMIRMGFKYYDKNFKQQ